MPGEALYSACICCHTGCDFGDIPGELILNIKQFRLLCIDAGLCLSAKAEAYPVGVIKEEGKIIKVGLPCCATALMVPDAAKLIGMDCQCLCLKVAGSLPFEGKVKAPICAVCFLQCSGDGVGCFQPPYMGKGGAPTTTEMER